jgi:DNA-binding transcriptional LysR family regulator
MGEQVAKDMVAVRIGPDMRMAVIGAPSYFARRPRPKKPQDLTAHDCINIGLRTYGGLYAWEFKKNGHELKVRVEGQLVFNSTVLPPDAALAGFGLVYLPEDQVQARLDKGRLIRVLADWCPPFAGYHLSYPSRRLATPAFALLVDALRSRAELRRLPHQAAPHPADPIKCHRARRERRHPTASDNRSGSE